MSSCSFQTTSIVCHVGGRLTNRVSPASVKAGATGADAAGVTAKLAGCKRLILIEASPSTHHSGKLTYLENVWQRTRKEEAP
jgi:hypothetical protein